MKPDKPTRDRNQGEGDRSSARRHNRRAREFVAKSKVEPAARDAGAYVERQPDDAGRAEREAKRGPRPTKVTTKVTIEELVAKGRTFADRIESLIHRIAGRLGRRSHR